MRLIAEVVGNAADAAETRAHRAPPRLFADAP